MSKERANLELLREIRKSRGKTQAEVAEAIGYKSKSCYCSMEVGLYAIDTGTANKIADFLNMTDLEKLAVFFPD
ncbi:helix-turn-helix domain-containing protein [Mediterraneibacter gnavus]|uniref:helix-turn-helix domain-containing protein n=1 Tax=Mediterraneibacter gnavus TaxID=33038 RepID=UPI0036D25DC6